ncbi:uncharacterized protein LOC107429578 isoform X1 [Ziziphus jujuba]|uniref:Uncharacterized protein LOC107429578 isoform X1 n=1 Tax=Ziziphus jujuba TaxID=326968 RepID=A0ABM3I1F2_ZIZJJ|nr:uncharacterized protein LOC107429578 isoform X1 [Ziziphus jujuba]
MRASAASPSSSLFITTYTPTILRRRTLSIFISSHPFLRAHHSHRFASPGLRLSASLAERNLQLSWFSPDHNATDDFGGWAISDFPPVHHRKRGLPIILISGLGTSVAVLLAAIAYFSLSRKGFKFQITSLLPLHGIVNGGESKTADYTAPDVAETSAESIPSAVSEDVSSAHVGKLEPIIIPVAVDSTQGEAISVLKKLKIIEDDVKADELCTRREYARWLVRMNSLLESYKYLAFRSPKHRITPSVSLSGSINAAFNDISVEDPDFGSIQALAEAGVIPSKLSKYSYDGLREQEDVCFFPDRFISRQDLIDWKAQLEYDFVPGMIQMSTTKVGFMDVKEIAKDVSPELYADMLAGDRSILRKVFGQIKRLQPKKPSTKAQAAVALSSGRMAEAIYIELLRLEAESSARLAEMEDIRTQLLDRGDIKRFWDEKLDEEKARGVEVEKVYSTAVSDLEQEKIVQEKYFAEQLKKKAAMDCQRQLLLSLKEEVNEISEKLSSERAMYVAEQCKLHDTLSDIQSKQEELLDSKSILEAEKEALRILRSWVEDDARRSQARAKVLEEVGRRWKWDNHA